MAPRDKWFPNVLDKDGNLDAQEVFQSTRLAWESIYLLQKDIEGTIEVVGDMVAQEREAVARSDRGFQVGDTAGGWVGSGFLAGGAGNISGGGGAGAGGAGSGVLNATQNRLPYLGSALILDARDAPEYDPATQALTIVGAITGRSTLALGSGSGTTAATLFFDAGTIHTQRGTLWLGIDPASRTTSNYAIGGFGNTQTRINADTTVRFMTDDTVEFASYSSISAEWRHRRRVFIEGQIDTEQLLVRGHSTQTSDIFVVDDDSGTDLLQVANSGKTTISRNPGTIPTETDTGTVLVLDSNAGANTICRLALIGGAGASGRSVLAFGDSSDEDIGRLEYRHTDNRLEVYTNDALQLTFEGTSEIRLDGRDLGNDTPGRCLIIERNTNAGAEGPAPGSIELEAADGVSAFLWSDDDGDLRIHTAKATGSTGTPTVDANTAGFKLSPVVIKQFAFSSPGGGSGTFWAAGFYDAPATDANLTQASTTQTLGTANHPYYAHAFLVAAAAGTASGGAGAVEIEVSGTSVDDNGVRTASDTEIIVADITTMSTDEMFETVKKWIGQVTYTLQNASGSTQTTFAADFNYGFAKYEDASNTDFELISFELVGRAGANDSGFNVELCEHTSVGWTYSAAAFVPGVATPLVDVAAIWSTESDLISGDHFAFKKLDLSTQIQGSESEGFLIRVTTTANNAVETMNITVGGKLN